MLRSHTLETYLWIILWVVLAFFLLIAETSLLPQPVIVMVNQIKEVLSLFVLPSAPFSR